MGCCESFNLGISQMGPIRDFSLISGSEHKCNIGIIYLVLTFISLFLQCGNSQRPLEQEKLQFRVFNEYSRGVKVGWVYPTFRLSSIMVLLCYCAIFQQIVLAQASFGIFMPYLSSQDPIFVDFWPDCLQDSVVSPFWDRINNINT